MITNQQEAEAILQNTASPPEAKQEAQEFMDLLRQANKKADSIQDEEEKKNFLMRIAEFGKGGVNKLRSLFASGDDLGKQLQDQMGDAYPEKINESIRKAESMNDFAKGAAGATEALGGDTGDTIDDINKVQTAIKDAGSDKTDLANTSTKLVNNLTGEGGENTETETETETELSEVGNGNPTDDATKIVEAATPEGDKNNRHYKAVKSIWSAYYDGDFGPPGSKEAKEVAWYYTIDSLGKLASNIGRSLRNVGAAYVGGAIDDGEDKSEWQEHRDSLRKEATGMDTESMGGKATRQATAENLSNQAQGIANARGITVNQLINEVKQKANEAKARGDDKFELAYLGFAASLAGAPVSNDQMLAMQATGLLDAIGKDGIIKGAVNWITGNKF